MNPEKQCQSEIVYSKGTTATTQKQRKNNESARGHHPGSRKNLKQWTKGCPSPNPRGRPKGSSITRLLRMCLDEIERDGLSEGEAVVRALIRQGKRGNVKAFTAIADRVEGRVPLPIASPGGGPIRVEFSFQDSGGLQTTEDELKAIDIEAIDIESDEIADSSVDSR